MALLNNNLEAWCNVFDFISCVFFISYNGLNYILKIVVYLEKMSDLSFG